MSEQSRSDTPSTGKDEGDMITLIKGIKQQLAFLEKKIDTLIKQSQERPFNQPQERPSKEKYFPRPYSKPFSKPFRSFGPSHRHDRAEHGREGYGKKEYDNNPRERDSDQGRPFEKRQGDENRGFSHKKKPFYHGRKKYHR